MPQRAAGLIPAVRFAELVDHVGRAAIDVNAVRQDGFERTLVENIGRVDDRRRLALGLVAGGQRPVDFARADGVHQRLRGESGREWRCSSTPFGRTARHRRPPGRGPARRFWRRRRRRAACRSGSPARGRRAPAIVVRVVEKVPAAGMDSSGRSGVGRECLAYRRAAGVLVGGNCRLHRGGHEGQPGGSGDSRPAPRYDLYPTMPVAQPKKNGTVSAMSPAARNARSTPRQSPNERVYRDNSR